MFDLDRDRELGEALEPRSAPRKAHEIALGDELERAFDSKMQETRREPLKKSHVLRKVFFGAAIAAALAVAACAAPVSVEVDVGKSVTIAYAAGGAMPEPKSVIEAVQGAGHFDDVNVRVRRQNDDIVVQMELWGDDAAETSIEGAVKKALPALAAAKITEAPLSGKVESTLGKKLGHDLFDMDLTNEKDVEVVRQKILADLAAKGVEGQVDVKVEGDGQGKRKVMIEVRQEGQDCEPRTPSEKKTTP